MTEHTASGHAARDAAPRLDMRQRLRALGPAAMVAACILGPGSITTLSVAGATYGYQLLWATLAASLVAFCFQRPVIRFTLMTRQSAMEGIRTTMGRGWSGLLYVALLLGAVAFQAGNFTGAALALNFFLPSIPIVVWVALLALAALIMCWVGVYRLLENVNRVIIGLIVLSFVLTALFAGPDLATVAATGFSFQVPAGNYWLILALIATTLPPNTVLGLSAFIKRKYANDHTTPMAERLALSRFDHTTNVVITGLVMVAILLCAGSVIHGSDASVSGATDMARQLTPMLGQYAGILFSLGLWAAGFSSGLFNIAVQPPLLGEALGRSEDAGDRFNRAAMLFAGLAPIAIVAAFGSTPIELILAAQAINGLLLPAIVGSIWVLCNRRRFLGELANTRRQNVVYGLVMLVVSLVALRVFLDIFGVI
ncbi:NRAMP (natural resistance-associated macrophage protein)-like metal ion transporter [Kushneria sinocarnis]|uniref:NRAMP (Natural resistance-associated macrophage protein)-like metal ion transporter n=1 Tax=Kushneria sinocarnis TaxID=595502 RepID=A0A420X112_9GAMM|nr:Nramp family divalent metal transporter [Kushneria sinocarnis]RKR07548.1 NRAMP (natural resistance-associated macrophage protein)-like metal ion transporter [Kushneria sinocarnis]